MGRAMIIITSGVLVALGIFNISTSQQGLSLTQKTVNNADYIMAKNTAHTAIQMAMQHINEDDEWAERHDKNNAKFSGPWQTVIDGSDVTLYTEYAKHPDYWQPDTLRLISNAKRNELQAEVISLYYKQPFSSLVPDFEGAISLPTGFKTFNADGNAHDITGTAPAGTACEDKPAIVVNRSETKDALPTNLNTFADPAIKVDNSLSYEPTDELIERLSNTSGVEYLTGNLSGDTVDMGSPTDPGVFFVEDDLKITGGKIQGYGILVIRSFGDMEYVDESGATLDLAGNFEFNGLVVFENAYSMDGRGTPTINGTMLIGNTDLMGNDSIDIDLGGNISINYDCEAEEYAKMAAADAVKQNKYTRRVTTEGVNYAQN
ncbi:hypothetical protein [Rhodohalobacter sp. 8-1]|uniref:hypothetical protein n=1 Tax=Rhodohalobacter sp. 8-1 TaxID=3131972 RepID=UPI0030ECC15D